MLAVAPTDLCFGFSENPFAFVNETQLCLSKQKQQNALCLCETEADSRPDTSFVSPWTKQSLHSRGWAGWQRKRLANTDQRDAGSYMTVPGNHKTLGLKGTLSTIQTARYLNSSIMCPANSFPALDYNLFPETESFWLPRQLWQLETSFEWSQDLNPWGFRSSIHVLSPRLFPSEQVQSFALPGISDLLFDLCLYRLFLL